METTDRGIREAGETNLLVIRRRLSAVLSLKLRSVISRIPDSHRLRYIRALLGTLSPRQAIRAKCVECVGYEDVRSRVSGCTTSICPLWAFRPYQSDESPTDELSDQDGTD